MTDLAGGAAAIEPGFGLGSLIDPEPLVAPNHDWMRWAGPLVSLLVLAASLYQLRHLPIRQTLARLPASPGFWLAFATSYLALPVSDWIIFRRLWGLPPACFPALLRKLVGNELLLSYAGELHFYAWARRYGARRQGRLSAAPFGAIKDVAILSAITGNGVTLAMLVFAAPFARSLPLGGGGRLLLLSIAFLLLSSLAVMLLRHRLFGLSAGELRFVAGVHLGRILVTIGLGALLWHLVLPAIGFGSWLLLGTFRQLVSRLPFLPEKDLVFAALVPAIVGSAAAVEPATALVAVLILASHLLVATALGAADLMHFCRERS